MDTTTTPEIIAVALQLAARGYAVMTKPGISLEADAKARIASQVEGTFLRKEDPQDGPTLEPIFSWTTPCPLCGEVHPT